MLNDIVAWIETMAHQIAFEMGNLGVMEWSVDVWLFLVLVVAGGLNLVVFIIKLMTD